MATRATRRRAVRLDPVQRTIDVAFGSIVRWSLYQFHRRLLETTDVTIDRSIVSILTRLNAQSPIRNSELADYLNLDRSTLSRQVATAIASGYVSRQQDASDSRAYHLSMTDLGRETLATVQLARERMIDEITSFMNEDERELVAKALPVVARALDQLAEARGGVPPARCPPAPRCEDSRAAGGANAPLARRARTPRGAR